MYDEDGSGEIDVDEFLVILRVLDPTLEVADVEGTFKAVGASGALDKEHFWKWCCNMFGDMSDDDFVTQIKQLLSEPGKLSTEPGDSRPQKLNETLYNLQQKMLNSSRSERKALKQHIADLDDRIARFHELTQKYKAY